MNFDFEFDACARMELPLPKDSITMGKKSRAKKQGTPPTVWIPLQEAFPSDPLTFACTNRSGSTMWKNDRYTVVHEPLEEGFSWISIRRNDRKACRDWRHFQRIKNELAGPDAEAIELYPAEDRLMDTANQYWLFTGPPGFRFPFGFTGRAVMTTEEELRAADAMLRAQGLEHGRATQRLEDGRTVAAFELRGTA